MRAVLIAILAAGLGWAGNTTPAAAVPATAPLGLGRDAPSLGLAIPIRHHHHHWRYRYHRWGRYAPPTAAPPENGTLETPPMTGSSQLPTTPTAPPQPRTNRGANPPSSTAPAIRWVDPDHPNR